MMLDLSFAGILPRLAAIMLAPTLLADSSSWALLDVRETVYNQNLAAVSPTGPVYLTNTACPAPTIKLGDPSRSASCVTKVDVAGQTQFAVQVGGAIVWELVLDSTGNVYVAGDAGPTGAGFEITPGVYETSPPGAPDPFVCKLNNTDGHALFCTFVDVAITGLDASVTVDSAGNTYIAGECGSDLAHTCVEKLNPDATALVYQTNLSGLGLSYLAADALGDLYVFYGFSLHLVKLDPGGSFVAGVDDFYGDLGGELPFSIALDPAGNPQVLSRGANDNDVRVTRYTPDLSRVLFDTSFSIGSYAAALGWAIDSAGVADVVGLTSGANLPVLHPTEVCHQPTGVSASINEFLVRIGNDGNVLQSTYFSGDVTILSFQRVFITPSNDGASVLVLDDSDSQYKALDLGPAISEVTLACFGNAASPTNRPLAPNEIISLFGTTLGPPDPVTGQAGVNGLYPFQLGGTEVTFDGTAAPMLYASSGQVNVVTPGALAGKTTTHVCVISNGAETNCIDAIIHPAAPGIFYSDQTGYAAALNQNGTINSKLNPAPIGSIVSVFATGLGSMTPSPPDGSLILRPLPVQDLTVLVEYPRTSPDGGSPAPPGCTEVLYAGPAPFEVEGVSQINLRVPPPPGPVPRPVSFWLSVTFPGGTTSSNAVLIW